ncbi:MAG TPA: hypothetical protein VFU48_15215 [Nitrospira sp.]|nr:hypothetical protein [Nitrospira sp.]
MIREPSSISPVFFSGLHFPQIDPNSAASLKENTRRVKQQPVAVEGHADCVIDGIVNLARKSRQEELSPLHFETGVLKFSI